MFGQAENLHFFADSRFDDIFQGVFGMARAELAGMTVVGEWHSVLTGSLGNSRVEKWGNCRDSSSSDLR